jgi:hypothetical protein
MHSGTVPALTLATDCRAVVIVKCGIDRTPFRARMGIVIQFRRPVASPEVIAKLVELGYLRPTKRHKADVVENAVQRLRQDLHRDGVISAGDLSPPPADDAPEHDRAPQPMSSSDTN